MQWSHELKTVGRGLRTALRAASAMAKPPALPRLPVSGAGSLVEIADFGTNPGALVMLAYVPATLQADAPLVVVLHGCGQGAAAFANGSGWMALADRLGCALVLPEQSADNNRQRCFNWFRPLHVARDQGEAASIRQMVAEAVRRFEADAKSVYVVGLSAGAAMTAALLAAYPDVFAAGAAVAGLPVGAASGAASALARMAQAGPEARSAEAWAEQVRRAAPPGYDGPWPRLSIWQGGLDTVVDPANAGLLVEQWRTLHLLGAADAVTTEDFAARHTQWGEIDQPEVELWTLPLLGHGYPTVAGFPLEGILPAGIAATDRIGQFWGLLPSA